jgi:protein transport protein SEC61 subunit gamma-like protein
MSISSKLKSSLKQYKRVLSISRKPSKEEFVAILKISGLGVIIIGLTGFVIQLLYQYIIRALM